MHTRNPIYPQIVTIRVPFTTTICGWLPPHIPYSIPRRLHCAGIISSPLVGRNCPQPSFPTPLRSSFISVFPIRGARERSRARLTGKYLYLSVSSRAPRAQLNFFLAFSYLPRNIPRHRFLLLQRLLLLWSAEKRKRK